MPCPEYGLLLEVHSGCSQLPLVMKFPALQSRERRAKLKVGLAISGGVDSMALAALCSQLQRPPIPVNDFHEPRSQVGRLPDLNFQAFVVDHDVRSGSDVEAQNVASVLEGRGNVIVQ